MALRDWSGWQVALLWLAGLLAAWLGVRRAGSTIAGRSTSGSGGLVGFSLPLALLLALLVGVVALLLVTVLWFRSRGGGGA